MGVRDVGVWWCRGVWYRVVGVWDVEFRGVGGRVLWCMCVGCRVSGCRVYGFGV